MFNGSVYSGETMSTHFTGMAGEMFVASECFRREWECSITLGNAKKVDLHVFDTKTNKGYTIDVKATRSGSWQITKRDVGPKPKINHFYVLLQYRGKFLDHMDNRPNCYIVPAKEIKKLITKGGKNGTQHLEWNMVRGKRYEENWNLIIKGGKRPVKSAIHGTPKPITCSKCGKIGHNKSHCPTPEDKIRYCSLCGKPGHDKRNCPN